MLNKMIILLVEDNPDDEELTRIAFQESKLLNEVVVARDGAEALDYLLDPQGKGHALPNLILLDLKLPKVDGLEVLKRLREEQRTRLLPVVVLTTSKEESDMINSYNLGCNSYIRKPVVFTDFIDAVRQLGMYWLMLNEPPPAWSSN
ncbi:response regulator [Noviherbaspirillum autotrophicum]|uniref:Chemotaxis protein CheY n=1 Tax=Noviherbaspirillum autotrophicum TaxID=709839 RepID=A0A0C2BJP8_9BURK|nr:response regulator [Noviherbaspirillum autotrophicum]KIF80239.1 chemotaxis protein CheY [Noviherbaspirillum autotrophicum]